MSKHSPGPWRWTEMRIGDLENASVLADAMGRQVLAGGADWGNGWHKGGADVGEHDARLIAAAPKLLEALKRHRLIFGQLDPAAEDLINEIEGDDTEVCGDCGAEFVGHHGPHDPEPSDTE